MKRVKGAVLAALLLGAGPAMAAGSEYADVHTVAAASALDGDIVVPGGMFAGGPTVVHTGWDLQTAFEQRVAALLGGRFEVRTGAVPASAFADLRPGVLDDFWNVVGDRVRALPQDNGIDAYVVAIPDAPVTSGQPWGGVQFLHLANRYGGSKTFVRLPFVVGVFDARTGKKIDYGSAKIPQADFRFPVSAECGEALWAEPPESLSDAQKEMIRGEAVSLIDQAVASALISAKLLSPDEAEAAAGPDTPPYCHN